MFAGFTEQTLTVAPDIEIFCRDNGPAATRPGLLLLHGNPQTSAMWHRVAPAFAADYHVVCADLRGYGRSAKPPTDADHTPYSKRAMAQDMVEVMRQLGHDRFYIGAHDRGARVAHRLAADHPDAVIALALLDIAPTREMYAATTQAFAQDYWHWFWMTQPAPFPERLMEADPDWFWKYRCGTRSAGMGIFADEALAEYLECFRDPATIHGSCEDYRAARTIDIRHDDEDGGRKLDMPLLAHWGAHGAIEKHFDCLNLWRRRANNVAGGPMPGGHYLAEELPDDVVAAFHGFFERYKD